MCTKFNRDKLVGTVYSNLLQAVLGIIYGNCKEIQRTQLDIDLVKEKSRRRMNSPSTRYIDFTYTTSGELFTVIFFDPYAISKAEKFQLGIHDLEAYFNWKKIDKTIDNIKSSDKKNFSNSGSTSSISVSGSKKSSRDYDLRMADSAGNEEIYYTDNLRRRVL